MKATKLDIAQLSSLYKGRNLYFGDMHNHANTGGKSDGKCTLEQWKAAIAALKMDFVAILDHRQVRHMYLPEWEDGLFVCGTEPGTKITDSKADDPHLHYNMIFPSSKKLEELLENHPEFEFEGAPEGFFKYPGFTREAFCALIDEVKARGGFFVHPHPKQVMKSNDPLDYWFRDETGIEVFYSDLRSEWTRANYELWTTLLAMGKRVWACSGEDGHAEAYDTALTAIYAAEKSTRGYLQALRKGDFVCGSVAIKMCVGDTAMGGACSFAGKRLALAVEDFHVSVKDPTHRYRLDVLTDGGVVHSQTISCTEPTCLAFDAEDVAFYRVEVFDETAELRLAIGNPIWNNK